MDDSLELKLSLIVVVALAGVYIGYEALTTPAGGHPFGHTLGIIGAVLMVLTEVLYSIRKRTRLLSYGPVRHWLAFHIFTGIVGPALVLMHTGLAFRGLAGITMLLTAVVVASGFIGRYIYTAVPRSLAGVEVDRRTMEAEAARQREALLGWSADKSVRVQALVGGAVGGVAVEAGSSVWPVLGRGVADWAERRRIRAAIRRLDREERARMGEIEDLLRRQQRLQRQIQSLQAVRRMMGWWHMAHVPLGLTLFASVAIHIVAALYYKGL
jgi:hypothetical protein